jgi:hypothetical protein
MIILLLQQNVSHHMFESQVEHSSDSSVMDPRSNAIYTDF